MKKIQGFLLLMGSNPIVQWLLKTGQTAAIAYIGASPFVPGRAWAFGLVAAVVSGVVHGFDIWLQGQVANAPTSPASGQAPVTHMDKLRAMVKGGVAILILGLLASPAMCWDVPSRAFGPGKAGVSVGAISPTETGVEGLLMPTANLGLNLFTGTPTYGYSLDEAFILANVSPVDATHTQISSIIGVTAGFYFDLGQWVAQTGPWVVKGELGLIGPDFGLHIVPGIQYAYNFQTGEKQMVVTGSIDLSAINILPIIKVFGL